MRTSALGDYETRQQQVLGNNGLYKRLKERGIVVSGFNLEEDRNNILSSNIDFGILEDKDKYDINYKESLSHIKERRKELEKITGEVKGNINSRLSLMHNLFYKVINKDFEDLNSLVTSGLVVVKDISDKFDEVTKSHEVTRIGLNNFYTQICLALDNYEVVNKKLVVERDENNGTLEHLVNIKAEEGKYIRHAAIERLSDRKTEINCLLTVNADSYKAFSKFRPELKNLKDVFNRTSTIFTTNNNKIKIYYEEINGTKSGLVGLVEMGTLTKQMRKTLENLNSQMFSVYEGVSAGIKEVESLDRNFKFARMPF